MFFGESPKIFELQRHTIPHFNLWNKSFWPFITQFSCRTDILWDIEQNMCPNFFGTDFILLYPNTTLKFIKNCINAKFELLHCKLFHGKFYRFFFYVINPTIIPPWFWLTLTINLFTTKSTKITPKYWIDDAQFLP